MPSPWARGLPKASRPRCASCPADCHHIAQPVGLLVDDLEQLPAFAWIEGTPASEHSRCCPLDGCQGRAKLMAHNAQELASQPLKLLDRRDVLDNGDSGRDAALRVFQWHSAYHGGHALS